MSEKKLFQEVPKNADFHSVVMTTFSFDFHHFESQVLRMLKSKGITNANIFADTNMLDQSIGFSTGHLKSISTSYSITGIHCPGAFHPKIALFAGENDVMLLQGSGNITNGGHGKNHELFSVFYANKTDQSQLPLIQEAWLYLKSLTSKLEGQPVTQLEWVIENCNLLSDKLIPSHQFHTLSEDFSAALLYNEKTSIWQQLKGLIETPIKKIKVFSPFYDEKGTLLNNLSNYFKDCPIDAFLQADKGIHPYKMEQKDNIRFLSWDSTNKASETVNKYNRKLHGKIFWFDAGEEQYCLFGSPNATIAAFGTDKNRGSNDEFAVLIKVKNRDLLGELLLNGQDELIQPQENIQIQSIENELEEIQLNNTRKIKLLGVDLDAKKLTVFISDPAKRKAAVCVIYSHWGIELERHEIDTSTEKVIIELSKGIEENAIAFVQLFDHYDEPISNKQIVNSLQDLSHTNPSNENRRLMKLSSLIETGNNGSFDIVDFYNTLQATRKLQEHSTSSKGGGDQDEKKKEEIVVASLTYEDAIVLDKETSDYKKILKQHNAIHIWDSIEKYFKKLAVSEDEEDMDDEEGGEATKSRKRKEKKPRTAPLPLRSLNILENKRKSIEKFLSNYLVVVKRKLLLEEQEVNQVDLAELLIVVSQLIQFTEREVSFPIEIECDKNLVLYPLDGNLSELNSFSGSILNILGNFVSLLSSTPFHDPHDDYSKNKLDHYKILARDVSLFTLSIVKNEYKHHPLGSKWSDLLANNILLKMGVPESIVDEKVNNFLKDVCIKNLNAIDLIKQLNNWISDFKSEKWKADCFYGVNLGISYIYKKIPATGQTKFLKLARPGFEYNTDEKDFVHLELYECETGLFRKSLQKLDSNKSAFIKK
jgi:hypothetical protein